VADGTRAVHALKPTLSLLKMMPLTEGVIIPSVATFLDGEGDSRRFTPSPETEDGATAMLDARARTALVPRCQRLCRAVAQPADGDGRD
jgi:hypothetical protein